MNVTTTRIVRLFGITIYRRTRRVRSTFQSGGAW